MPKYRRAIMIGLSLTAALTAASVYVLDPMATDCRWRPEYGMQVIKSAALLFSVMHNRAPKDLRELVEDMALNESSQHDPWHRQWQLRCSASSCEIASGGPDQRFGNEDDVRNKFDLPTERSGLESDEPDGGSR